MHYWLIDRAQRMLMIQVKGAGEMLQELEASLYEPIPGITREDRYDEMEAAAFAQFQDMSGMG